MRLRDASAGVRAWRRQLIDQGWQDQERIGATTLAVDEVVRISPLVDEATCKSGFALTRRTFKDEVAAPLGPQKCVQGVERVVAANESTRVFRNQGLLHAKIVSRRDPIHRTGGHALVQEFERLAVADIGTGGRPGQLGVIGVHRNGNHVQQAGI